MSCRIPCTTPPDNKAWHVQIKTTQGGKVGIIECPDYLIVLHMSREGEFEEVYKGRVRLRGRSRASPR